MNITLVHEMTMHIQGLCKTNFAVVSRPYDSNGPYDLSNKALCSITECKFTHSKWFGASVCLEVWADDSVVEISVNCPPYGLITGEIANPNVFKELAAQIDRKLANRDFIYI